jgi:acetyl esterase/lipase
VRFAAAPRFVQRRAHHLLRALSGVQRLPNVSDVFNGLPIRGAGSPRRFDHEPVAIAGALSYRFLRTLGDAAGNAARSPAYRISQARSSADILSAALIEALGPDYRQRMLTPVSAAPLPPSITRGLKARRRYARHTDIAYGPAGPCNLLDIWRSTAATGPSPVLIHLPGGAWIAGRKRGQGEPLMAYLAERGWVCVSINYRLALRDPWPAAIVDVRRAIAWVKANIGAYGGDPSFIALEGGSAGAHLAALAALSANDKEWQPGFEAADTSIQAVVALHGVYDWNLCPIRNPLELAFLERYVVRRRYVEAPEEFLKASPLHRISPEAPPFFVLHGSRDRVVPVGPNNDFVRSLRMKSRSPVAAAELPGAPHSFDILATRQTDVAVRAIEEFLAVIYREHTDAATRWRKSRT